MPAVNMRSERNVMIMYASRPTEFSDVMPRKSDIRDKTVRDMVASRDVTGPLVDYNEVCYDTDLIEKVVSWVADVVERKW